MILHAVYLSPDRNHRPDRPYRGHAGPRKFGRQIEGFTRFQHGANVDLEGKSPESPYGFHAIFTDRAALARYAMIHATKPLCPTCGLVRRSEAIKVYDIETAKTDHAPYFIDDIGLLTAPAAAQNAFPCDGRPALMPLLNRGTTTPRLSPTACARRPFGRHRTRRCCILSANLAPPYDELGSRVHPWWDSTKILVMLTFDFNG
jgi:hypothetical protein